MKRLGRNSEGHVLHAHSHDRRQREKDILEVLRETAVCLPILCLCQSRELEFSSYFLSEIRIGVAVQKTLSPGINLLWHFMEAM